MESETVWHDKAGNILLLIWNEEQKEYSFNYRTRFGEFRKLEYLPIESLPSLVRSLLPKVENTFPKKEWAEILVGHPLYFRNKKGQIERLMKKDPLEKLLV